VTLTYRSRAKFELSPDFENWTNKGKDALWASLGKKLKIKSRKLPKSRKLAQVHAFFLANCSIVLKLLLTYVYDLG
jgi:hypothetical protein